MSIAPTPPGQDPLVSSEPQAVARQMRDARRKEQTRQRMLDAAFRLIGNSRGRNIRIEEVCALSHTSRASFYNHFSSLELLFEALAYDVSHDFTLDVIRAMDRFTSAAAKVDFALRSYLGRIRTDPEWGWAMVHIGAAGPLFGIETFQSALRTVSDGIERGEFSITDAEAGRDLVLGTAHAAFVSHLSHGSDVDQPRRISQMVLRGLGVDERQIASITQADPFAHTGGEGHFG